MKKILLIVESPAKIKTIKKFLGNNFKIMATVGHVKDLPPKRLGVTIDDSNDSIDIEYVALEDKSKIIADICKEARTASEIYLAPDPDREGEIIAWHIGQEIEKVYKGKEPIHRISFNEITKPAIEAAIGNPGSIDLKKVAAQQARRILDRWVGYEVSPILWRKVRKGTSAGRVQSVALRLICDREKAIREFKPEEYWSITGIFLHNRDQLSAELTHIGKKKAEINNEKASHAIIEKLNKAEYVIDSIVDSKRLKNALPPFMTSSLQQAAFNRLGFNVKKTMQIAQKLYEGVPLEDANTPVALITYMRTDSLRIADSAVKQTRDYITTNFDKEYLPTKALVYAKKGKSQDAHEAIRPIDVRIMPDHIAQYVTSDIAKIYRLIWQRFVACQMSPAQYAQRQVTIIGDQKYIFKITGSTMLFDGFLKVYAEDADEKEQKVILPKTLKEKDRVKLEKIDPKQHFTQAPPRYTEGSLVKELEKAGIGRPSTYATILNTIRERSYTTLDQKKRFIPTELGMTVTQLLVENLPDIMDITFTAHMEEELDKIAHDSLDRDTLLRNFHKVFQKELKKFAGVDGKHKITQQIDIICPECKKHNLAIRFGKAGEFLGCTDFPECTFTSNFKRAEDGTIELIETPQQVLINLICPMCSKQLRQLVGRYGPFIGCSGYPECKYIHQEKASFKCPIDEGDVVKRKWRGGTLWGCRNYPKCTFTVFGDIEETPCPVCKLPFLVKKIDKKNNLVVSTCSNKDCSFSSSAKTEKNHN